MIVNKILERLSSEDESDVIKVLFELGADETSKPDVEVVAKVLELASHPYPGIRERAVVDISMHWKLPQSYRPILNMVQGGEKDETTMLAAIGGLGVLVGQCKIGDIQEASRALAKLALSGDTTQSVRDAVNRVLLLIHRKITVADYGRAVVRPSAIPFDRSWLEELSK